MYKKLSIIHLVIISFLGLVFASTSVTANAQAAGPGNGSYRINTIQGDLQGDSLALTIGGNSIPAYTVYELFNPSRLIIDIAEASLADGINTDAIVPPNGFTKLAIKELDSQDPRITRFEITINASHRYQVDKQGNNLLVQIYPESQAEIASLNEAPASVGQTAVAATVKAEESLALHKITVSSDAEKTEIILHASAPIETFTHNTVAGSNGLPDRMFIDINNIDGSKIDRQKDIGGTVDKIRVASRGSGVRVVFDSSLSEMFSYDISTAPQGLIIVVQEPKSQVSEQKAVKATEEQPSATPADETLAALIDSSAAALASKKTQPEELISISDKLKGKFEFSGYKSQKISVDFYKIDLHNVFRLFREISDVNIIVDEAVSGSLTLALNDVPWTFALDVILNLKKLKKEERYNTIVIYPAETAFSWPERAMDNLSFEADIEVVEQEALIIQQSANQPKEIMQAKEFIRKAKIEESDDDIEDAAAYYEQAFQLWPNNPKLSNRLATLYLANLGMNAKAIYFAEKSLQIDPSDTRAALYAAIGHANMGNIGEAGEYFSQSISDDIPMKEALISYAAFSEENNHPEAAIKLLDRYQAVYGESIDTMISKARIYDHMGKTDQATAQYRALLGSGFQLVPGLKDYIRERLAANPGQ